MKLNKSPKVKVEFLIDLETGEYSSRFFNVSCPGDSIDYSRTMELLKIVVKDVDAQITEDVSSESGEAQEMIH